MTDFKLTNENYYNAEANQIYMSASQVKAFMKCEAAALAEIRGEYVRPVTPALLVGSYVDAHFEGTLDIFRAQHPEIFKRDGSLKSEYVRAEEMIARAEADEVFMEYMQGEKQAVLSGLLFGVLFKCKLDVYVPGVRIVDLKTVRDFEPQYLPEQGRVDFATAWNWPLQMAIYQAVEGNTLPTFLNCITKQDPPDIGLFAVPQEVMDVEMSMLADKIPYYDALKQGLAEPERCENCAYCRATRKLSGAVDLSELAIF